LDEELKQYLGAMETRFNSKMADMENRLNGKMADMENRLDEKMADMEARLDAKIEKVETTLLTEFHKWASPADARARTHAAALRAIDLEMEALSDRVQKLEGAA
jgi:hypothetical protein